MIGAGSSGIAALKALAERGIPVDCFECSDRVGGNWVFGNRNGMSSAYRSLHTNTSRDRMGYSDFPMPASYPDFPHHTQIADYFEDYARHFGLMERITFETGVERATRDPADGTWTLQPLGALMPLAEAQGRWVASYLRGEYRLPPRSEMEREMRREHERMRRRYVASKRHTMEVDFDDYLFALRRELRAGTRRAREAGFPLPVAPRAQAHSPAVSPS